MGPFFGVFLFVKIFLHMNLLSTADFFFFLAYCRLIDISPVLYTIYIFCFFSLHLTCYSTYLHQADCYQLIMQLFPWRYGGGFLP